MKKMFMPFAVFFLVMACTEKSNNEQQQQTNKEHTFRMYSKSVSDSFTVFINLPNDYKKHTSKKYPVVYLLDANLYFDIVAAALNKYSEVGLAPSVILAGIGYKDFPTMDSLRTRDDTYPIAIPEYEMAVSGGADKFLSFINNELIPKIDNEYNVDTSKQVLMGHSLGGYFTAYAFLQYLTKKSSGFSSYIAASPSIHYNKYWLLDQLENIQVSENNHKKTNLYITYGGLEDAENENDPNMMRLAPLTDKLSGLLTITQLDFVNYKSDIFSNLDHMDTQLPTFIKGLQWSLKEENSK